MNKDHQTKITEAKLEAAEQRVKELEEDLLMLTIATGRKETWDLGKKLLNKFAIEKQIEVLACIIKKHSTVAGQSGASGPFRIIEVEYVKKEIEQLRAKLGGE